MPRFERRNEKAKSIDYHESRCTYPVLESLPQIYTNYFFWNSCNEMMNDEYLWESVRSMGGNYLSS